MRRSKWIKASKLTFKTVPSFDGESFSKIASPKKMLLRPYDLLSFPFWGLLGASWGAFWGLLAPLGGSWGPLGGLLGASWGDNRKKSKNRPPKWTILGPKMGPKWDPKRTKIEDKIEHQKSTSLRPPWGRLGAILGRFRCLWGGQKSSKFIGFYKVF